MATDERSALIDGEKRLGTVTKVGASAIELNLPQALAAAGRRGIARGTVGDFVFIDCDQAVILGRIVEVSIPDRNRPALERQIEREPNVEPVGRVQLLATIQKTTQTVVRGVLVSPRIGDGIFEANGPALSCSIQTALLGEVNVQKGVSPITVSLGRISSIEDADIALPPEKLFGRHCGIFGATGGGKSWTLAKLISEVALSGGKAIVFDPTGEFSGKVPDAVEYAFTRTEDDQVLVRFPSKNMTELSLFTLLRPTGQSQGPTMREAIRSLRLSLALRNDPAIESKDEKCGRKYFSDDFGAVLIEADGTIKKTGQSISEFNQATTHYSHALASEVCNFDVNRFVDQIINECIWPSDNKRPDVFGEKADNTLNYCNTLIVRVRGMLESAELKCLFGDKGEDICNSIKNFLKDPQKRICLISFKNVSFNHNTRELLLNTIGEYLLGLARANQFRAKPVICFLDEAHQFMGRSVGDEFNNVSLDAFGFIAKEGRKYGLTAVLATQRPRDVPQGVLSQLGTLFVHRLTNERDRETIERACSDLDRSAAAFIPSLSQGEAIVLGHDLPVPLPIRITPPDRSAQPTSRGPDYQQAWS
ncbi:MAG: ATP-binding protein [Aestuariivita sp.]|nr:ATP-binding protein [Aestuariivita sp.]